VPQSPAAPHLAHPGSPLARALTDFKILPNFQAAPRSPSATLPSLSPPASASPTGFPPAPKPTEPEQAPHGSGCVRPTSPSPRHGPTRPIPSFRAQPESSPLPCPKARSASPRTPPSPGFRPHSAGWRRHRGARYTQPCFSALILSLLIYLFRGGRQRCREKPAEICAVHVFCCSSSSSSSSESLHLPRRIERGLRTTRLPPHLRSPRPPAARLRSRRRLRGTAACPLPPSAPARLGLRRDAGTTDPRSPSLIFTETTAASETRRQTYGPPERRREAFRGQNPSGIRGTRGAKRDRARTAPSTLPGPADKRPRGGSSGPAANRCDAPRVPPPPRGKLRHGAARPPQNFPPPAAPRRAGPDCGTHRRQPPRRRRPGAGPGGGRRLPASGGGRAARHGGEAGGGRRPAARPALAGR